MDSTPVEAPADPVLYQRIMSRQLLADGGFEVERISSGERASAIEALPV